MHRNDKKIIRGAGYKLCSSNWYLDIFDPSPTDTPLEKQIGVGYSLKNLLHLLL